MVASVTSVPPRRKYSWHSHNKLPRNAAGRGVGIYRVGLEIGSLAAALGGLDTLVFTAGIGEHAPLIRHKICEAAEWLGVALDDDLNQNGAGVVGARDSSVDILVIPANEEQAVARELLTF